MAPSECSAASLFTSPRNTITIYLKDLTGRRATAFLCRQNSPRKWDEMEQPQSLLQEKAFQAAQWGPGTQANKGLCFLLQGCPCWGVTSSWNKTRAGTMEWHGRNQFLNVFKYSSVLSLSQAYNQTGTWANLCCSGPEVVVAVFCWNLSLWSAAPRNMEPSVGWPALMAAVHGGLWGSCQALCWLWGVPWLFTRCQCVLPAVKWRHLFSTLPCTRAGPRLASWLSPVCSLPAKAAPPITRPQRAVSWHPPSPRALLSGGADWTNGHGPPHPSQHPM